MVYVSYMYHYTKIPNVGNYIYIYHTWIAWDMFVPSETGHSERMDSGCTMV